MRAWLVLVGVAVSTLASGVQTFPKEGSYFGYIAPDDADFKILTRFDVLKANSHSDPTGSLVVFLKNMLGSFYSHEYHTQVYRIADYLWTDPKLALDMNKNDPRSNWSIVDGLFSPDGNTFKSRVQSRLALSEGELQLVYADGYEEAIPKLEALYPDRFVLPQITGEYYCMEPGADLHEMKKIRKALQFEAARRETPEFASGHALNGYRITGRMGDPKRNWLNPYVWFEDALYEFHDGIVTETFLNLHCVVKEKGLDCVWEDHHGGEQKCFFERKKTTLELLINSPPEQHDLIFSDKVRDPAKQFHEMSKWRDAEEEPEPVINIPKTKSELLGAFSGYLFLEDRKIHTRMSLEFGLSGDLIPNIQNDGLDHNELSLTFKTTIKSFAQRMTDEEKRRERIYSFSFDTLPIPEKPVRDLTFMGQKDAILKITHWDNRQIGGEWYSKTGAHVGHFLVKRGPLKDLKPWPGCHLGHDIAGQYSAFDLIFYLSAARDPSAVAFSGFPIKPAGSARLGRYREIYGVPPGTFDPFTGVMSFDLSDGRHFLGRVTPRGMLGVLTQVNDLGNPWIRHDLHHFHYSR